MKMLCVCVCICGKHVERRHRRDDLLRVSSCVVCDSSTGHPVFAQATACRLHGDCDMCWGFPPWPRPLYSHWGFLLTGSESQNTLGELKAPFSMLIEWIHEYPGSTKIDVIPLPGLLWHYEFTT